LKNLEDVVVTLAECEGLYAHAESVRIRSSNNNSNKWKIFNKKISSKLNNNNL